MKILVTGNAGFIGFHTVLRLLKRGDCIIGIDVVNDYYDPSIKKARLKLLEAQGRDYHFIHANLADRAALDSVFAEHRFDRVIHLAAQAGVRHSIANPMAYVESNIIAFTNVLEACRYAEVPHLTYASTSSVYGANLSTPFSETQAAVHPLQFYAATKRANELMAHSYSHLFRLPTTGLRFFTVYGPWGRPDMALFLFTNKIINGEPINVYNYGNHTRDSLTLTISSRRSSRSAMTSHGPALRGMERIPIRALATLPIAFLMWATAIQSSWASTSLALKPHSEGSKQDPPATSTRRRS